MAELLSSSKARNVIMTFWNSEELGIETTEIKMKKTALAAIHDCGLVGKVSAVERTIDGQKRLFLINVEKAGTNGNAK